MYICFRPKKLRFRSVTVPTETFCIDFAIGKILKPPLSDSDVFTGTGIESRSLIQD